MIRTASYRNNDPHTPASNLPPSNGTILVNSYHLSSFGHLLDVCDNLLFLSLQLPSLPLQLPGERRGGKEGGGGRKGRAGEEEGRRGGEEGRGGREGRAGEEEGRRRGGGVEEGGKEGRGGRERRAGEEEGRRRGGGEEEGRRGGGKEERRMLIRISIAYTCY